MQVDDKESSECCEMYTRHDQMIQDKTSENIQSAPFLRIGFGTEAAINQFGTESA